MKLKDIGRISGREIITTKPDSPLSEAIKQLVNNEIGAMPVCDLKGTLVGILSERDILKWIHRHHQEIEKARVKDVMTSDVIIGVPEDELDEILKTMTEKGIRHIPVMAGTVIVGMLSIRDVIEERLTECNSQVRYLHDYIAGGPA